jgi:hypothetical protein
MVSRIRSRLTYANVVASLALFLVLSGGTAVALTGSNTVFSDDIVNGQVKATDLGPGSVGGSEVQDNSVTGADVKESSLARVPQAGNAGSLDGLDSTHFGTGVMGGVMKDVGFGAVASGTVFAPSGASAAAATGPSVAPAGGFVARDLEISLAAPNGPGQSRRFDFFRNPSAATTLSCTVPENASSCSDTSHAVTVSEGQSYGLIATSITGGAPNVDVSFGWRATSP